MQFETIIGQLPGSLYPGIAEKLELYLAKVQWIEWNDGFNFESYN